MAYIIETPNPFAPLVGLKKHIHPGGISIRQWLQRTYPGFVEFEKPTICIVNGEPVLRKNWNREIKEKDIINFITVVGYEWVAIIIAVIIVAVTVALVLTMPTPVTPGELPASDPVFSIKGQTNAIRLGEPIEVCYGRNRIYPSYASRPFFRYQGNDQFQHSLFCLGHGEFTVHEVRIGDTLIEDFQEVEYEIIPPGGSTVLFATNVITSAEAGGQTLFAPNEADFVGPSGWVGPFPTNPSGTEINRIEIDLVFPRGIYQVNKEGKKVNMTIRYEFQKRLIDNLGNPLGDWTVVIFTSITRHTTTPQRITYSQDVALGRYEVRGRRDDDKDKSFTAGNDIVWEGLRGFIAGEDPDYGDVTLLAVKIRATNNLNSRTQEKFNVLATRKLPIRNSGGGFSDPVETRSIVWAFVDVFRSQYGGRITDELFFDWDALEALDAFYEGRDEHFDWVFRDPITVWEAAMAIANCGRAVPLLVGSLVTMKRDGPLSIPVTMFTPDNIVKGSFQWDIKLWDPDEFDSIQIEYTEPSTGYTQEQVLCSLPGDTSDHPQDLRLPGVQDRNHAYRQGLYLLASRRYLRENVSFETGMEGFIPSYGDLIAVVHDVPRWGQSGYILGVEEESGGVYHLHVSEPLVFSESNNYQIMLRDKHGAIVGPVDAEETADPKVVTIVLEEEVDFLLGGETDPMLFLFGVVGDITKYGRVVKIEPQGGERVKITMVNEETIIHSFDSLEAPALDTPTFPLEVPDLPEIPALYLAQIDGPVLLIQATWLAAFGAQRYIVQISESEDDSEGEGDWRFVGETTRTSMEIQVAPGEWFVRVAAINNGQGPWIQESIVVGLVAGLTNNIPWLDMEWGILWWLKTEVDAYQIKIYDNSGSVPVLKRTVEQTGTDYLYTFDLAYADDNITREMLVEVDSMLEDETTGVLVADGAPRSLELFNTIPTAPINLVVEFLGENSSGGEFDYKLTWENPYELDLIRVKVWLSAVQGFDPEVVEPLIDEIVSEPSSAGIPDEAFIGVPIPDYMHPDWYWRVAIFDVWGNELSTNLTAEHIIAPGWILEAGDWDDFKRWEDFNQWND